MSAPFIQVPIERLDPDTLEAVIEAYVTREGTDYGLQEFSLAQKVEQVRRQLVDGAVVLVFDVVQESCTLLAKEEFVRIGNDYLSA